MFSTQEAELGNKLQIWSSLRDKNINLFALQWVVVANRQLRHRYNPKVQDTRLETLSIRLLPVCNPLSIIVLVYLVCFVHFYVECNRHFSRPIERTWRRLQFYKRINTTLLCELFLHLLIFVIFYCFLK